jgi:3-oxoacyl-[acyl-carrier protein] reductase
MDLKDTVAVVVGEARELESAVCLRLARAGANIALATRSEARQAKGIVEAITALSREALAESIDLTDYEAVSAFLKKVVAKWGKLDILVTVAGPPVGGGLDAVTDEQLDEAVDDTVRPAFHAVRAAAPVFREQESGRVINLVGSEASIGPGSVASALARGAVLGLTRAAARELGPHQVRVNAVVAGLVETPALKNIAPETLERALSLSTLGRMARPEDVADVVLFLASSRSRHLTGEILRADGGSLE